jgi:Transcriptional Coactivator p15 (PC4)
MAGLTEPLIVGEWRKNRGGQSIRVRLSTYEGHNLIDVRTWHTADGRLVPGKGFACGVRHLPRLIDALTTALDKARELNLFGRAS